jgi:hypothetical protein
MITDIITDPLTYWFLLTAVIFTLLGRWMAYHDIIHNAVEATLDSLIKQGYIKTKGVGEDMEILKVSEWCSKDD